MTLRLIIDILIAALLAATVCYCFILNRKLGQLRSNQDEMKRLISEFDRAMAQARIGLSELRGASSEADASLRATLESARTMADELAIMTRSADRLASRLVANGHIDPVAEHRKARSEDAEHGEAAPVPAPSAAAQDAVRVARAAAASLGSALAGQAAPVPSVGRSTLPARRPVAGASSDAERELLNALRRVK